MQYLKKSFTLPSSGNRVSQRHWDYSFLSREQFENKYGRDTTQGKPQDLAPYLMSEGG